MSKYDCSRTAEFFHELNRMCKFYTNRDECYTQCPLTDMACDVPCDMENFENREINLVQQWSDNHPEMPRITLEEQNFLEAFKDESLLIARYGSGLRLVYGGTWINLHGTMFSFININQPWTIGELLKLEVEE